MILRFLFVVVLVYGTWELTGNRALLLNNGISFIAGIIVATAVLMLLTVFQIFIQYTLDTRASKIPFASRIDPARIPQRLTWAIVFHMVDLFGNASAEKSRGIDTFVAAVIITKLLLSWNMNSDWFGSPIFLSPIRIFFLFLHAVHQMAAFVSIGISILTTMRNIMRSIHGNNHGKKSNLASLIMDSLFVLHGNATRANSCMSHLVATWCGLVVAALNNSQFLDVVIDDASSSLTIYKDTLVSDVVNCILIATVGVFGVMISLILPLNMKATKASHGRDHSARSWCLERLPSYLLTTLVVYLFSACLLIRFEDLIYYTLQSVVLHACCAVEMCRSEMGSSLPAYENVSNGSGGSGGHGPDPELMLLKHH